MTTGIEQPVAEPDLHCPLCEYNLRGLAEPRCPECGFKFEWRDLTDPSRRIHPYLFEHHPWRNVRSFIRTLWGSLRPRSFWSSLRPTQPSRPQRMTNYWIIVSSFAMGFLLVGNLGRPVRQWHQGRRDTLAYIAWLQTPQAAAHVRGINATFGSIQAYMARQYAIGAAIDPSLSGLLRHLQQRAVVETNLLPWLTLILSWPWVTFAVLLIYNTSMRRARIQRHHVMRCALYSADAFLFTGLILFGVMLIAEHRDDWRWHAVFGLTRSELIAALIVLAIAGYRIAVAYRVYLRFPHAVSAALCAQVIVLLVLAQSFLIVRFGL